MLLVQRDVTGHDLDCGKFVDAPNWTRMVDEIEVVTFVTLRPPAEQVMVQVVE